MRKRKSDSNYVSSHAGSRVICVRAGHWFVVTLLMLSVLLTAFATPVAVQGTADSTWRAVYWDNRSLAGAPVVVRAEPDVDHNWGTGAPAPAVPADNFSARWTRTLNLPEGVYRFTVTVDDGVRLWVNDQLIINEWQEQDSTTYSAELFLPGGPIPVRVEYFEGIDLALIQLSWQRLDEVIEGPWRGEFFNNTDLSGSPALIRSPESIGFNWGTGSPAPSINPDTFSARWTRTLDLAPGRYRFTVTVDDGARLWVNNNLIINEWQVQSPTTYDAEITLPGGGVPIRLEYFEAFGGALIQLSWMQIDVVPAPPPQEFPVDIWRGEYFDDVSPGGNPTLVRATENIDFNWESGSPAPDLLGTDRFSARWTRTLRLTPGIYRFTTVTDDGVRLWVDGQQVINDWEVQSASTSTAVVEITDPTVPVQMEYFENTGVASASLRWDRVDAPSPAPGDPTATIAGASFLNVRTGPSVAFRSFTVLPRGEVVELIGRNRSATWIQIQLANGQTGWVNGRYLATDYRFANLPVTS